MLRWVRRRPVGLVRRLDAAEPAVDLVVPGEWPVMPLVLLNLYWEQWTMGDAGGSSTAGLASRARLGDRSGGESAAWS